ncbi:TatD family hydrolase [Phaeodactylibacter xiamenensis]|jgi:TatD DNase family protein|uniref:TatD family hydrolase n=1 Tax=Phaeodactylibacter xiamenensis TaxID=1524460 RepID=UPI0024A7ACF2|nr:TatD family hydrolase [Phaeodactylibacter xiamenensis]
MRLIDTHAHLYSRKFDADRAEMVERAMESGVDRFFLPNIDHASIEGMLKMEEDYPGQCFAMMGIHPCSIKENYKEELAVVEKWLGERPFCAIGEIGIDLYWDKTHFRQQQDAFRQQIQWAKALDIPIVIHSRDATAEVLEILDEQKDERLRGIFHCFTGTLEEARRIIDLDFYLGIGGVVTFKNGGLDKVVQEISLEHLVLETDAPYLAPVPKRGKRNESAYVRLVAEKIAAVQQVPFSEVARQTTANAEALFRVEELTSQSLL